MAKDRRVSSVLSDYWGSADHWATGHADVHQQWDQSSSAQKRPKVEPKTLYGWDRVSLSGFFAFMLADLCGQPVVASPFALVTALANGYRLMGWYHSGMGQAVGMVAVCSVWRYGGGIGDVCGVAVGRFCS